MYERNDDRDRDRDPDRINNIVPIFDVDVKAKSIRYVYRTSKQKTLHTDH